MQKGIANEIIEELKKKMEKNLFSPQSPQKTEKKKQRNKEQMELIERKNKNQNVRSKSDSIINLNELNTQVKWKRLSDQREKK